MAGEDISAFIMAGGQSKRFGRDKALFPYRGVTLIERVIGAVRTVIPRVAIIADTADRYRFPDIPCYADIMPGLGPAGGVYTAVRVAETGRAFVFACDMPDLEAGLIRYMISVSDGYDVTIPLIGGNYEPLHAVYSRECGGPMEKSIRRGERRIVGFFDDVRVRPVTEEEIRKFADPSRAFRNLNFLHEAGEEPGDDTTG